MIAYFSQKFTKHNLSFHTASVRSESDPPVSEIKRKDLDSTGTDMQYVIFNVILFMYLVKCPTQQYMYVYYKLKIY